MYFSYRRDLKNVWTQSVGTYFHFIADRAITSFFFKTKMLENTHVTNIGTQTQ